MTVELKRFTEILLNWKNHVSVHSKVQALDFNEGSVIRAIGEASSFELDKLYVQLAAILNLFSIDKCTGTDLDERAADFSMVRKTPTKSTSEVTLGDSTITSASVASGTLAGAVSASATSLTVSTTLAAEIAAIHATQGYIILSRGAATEEKVAYTGISGGTITVGATTYAHALGALVHRATREVAEVTHHTFDIGTKLATRGSPTVNFTTTAEAILYDGDYQVLAVPIKSENTGLAMNVGVDTVSVISNPPLATATVTNTTVGLGGADIETDTDFRSRIKVSQQSLTNGTAKTMREAVLGLTYGESTIQHVKVQESVSAGEVTVYIHDGSATYSPSSAQVSRTNILEDPNANTITRIVGTEILAKSGEAGQKRFQLKNWPLASPTIYAYISRDNGVITGATANTITASGASWGTSGAWDGYYVKDDNNNIWAIVSHTNISLVLRRNLTSSDIQAPSPVGHYAIFSLDSSTAYTSGNTSSLLTVTTDYTLNTTNGQLELVTGLTAGQSLLLSSAGVSTPPTTATAGAELSVYSYHDGLLQVAQKTINGDPEDLTTYPGEKAVGTKVTVTEPTTTTQVSVVLSIQANADVVESELYTDVKSAVVAYINALGMGEDVFVSKIVEAALSVVGVTDVTVTTPAANSPIADDEIARTSSTLVTVS